MTDKLLCIYHANCADGFTAAWVVRKHFDDAVEFHPGVYQDPPPDATGRHVLLVDFSYKRSVLLGMARTALSIRVLDHHKSAMEDLRNIMQDADLQDGLCPVSVVFDMERSGAMLAWDEFFPGKSAPRLVQHVQDRDLWRFSLPHTREVQANVFSYEYTFEQWDLIAAELQDPISYGRFVQAGEAIERKHFKDIKEFIAAAAQRKMVSGWEVPVLNAPYFWSSDAGHLMAQGQPFAACYWDTPAGRVFSLRSAEDGLDVSEIAKKYGGGGHKHAAGFRLGYDELNRLLEIKEG